MTINSNRSLRSHKDAKINAHYHSTYEKLYELPTEKNNSSSFHLLHTKLYAQEEENSLPSPAYLEGCRLDDYSLFTDCAHRF